MSCDYQKRQIRKEAVSDWIPPNQHNQGSKTRTIQTGRVGGKNKKTLGLVSVKLGQYASQKLSSQFNNQQVPFDYF